MAVIIIPEKAMERPRTEVFNSVIVAMATPINITLIGGIKERSVLIP